MSVETLYLVIERPQRPQRRWRGIVITKITRKRPLLKRPSEQALLKLRIDIPDTIMEPRAISVQIKPEDIIAPTTAVTAVKDN